MTAATATVAYARFELLRTLRSVRFFLFTLAFPLLLFVLVAGPNRHQTLDGVPFALYYLSGMIAWGTMAAIVAPGARIAAERSVGWNRQLRSTPLRVRSYLQAKLASGYLMAIVDIVLLSIAGLAMGVHLSAGHWALMTLLVLVGLIPFAVLGVLIGHLVTAETMGPAMGGATAVLALLGGSWGPIATHGALHSIIEYVPSYWLVQAGKLAAGGGAWPLKGWIVMAAWTVVLARLAARAYQRDTGRA